MKILVIGGGNMGLTYARSFLRSNSTNHSDLMILEKSAKKAAALAQQNIGTVYATPDTCLHQADLIILAVKPQDSTALFDTLRPHVDPQQVFVSIMAGITVATIAEALGISKVIRAMPNLPAQIGMGMTVFTSTDAVTRIELVMVQNLINTTGKSIYVEKEAAIDAATAISGSGPAYVWYFMNSLIQAAQDMGFSPSESELLVSQTFKGAIDLFDKTDFSCSEWITKVCSRGGTTEAALQSYATTTLEAGIVEGARAALKRAEELGA